MKKTTNQPPSKLSRFLDSIKKGDIEPQEIMSKINCDDVLSSIYPTITGASERIFDDSLIVCSGVNASPGAAKGILALDSDTAEAWNRNGKKVILLLPFFTPDDVPGIISSYGAITAEGGATGHAAVVARQFGIPAVVGCTAIKVDIENRRVIIDNNYVSEGEEAAVDGTIGKVYFSSRNRLPLEFDNISSENFDLLESLVSAVSDVIEKRVVVSAGLELAILVTLIQMHKKKDIEDLVKIKLYIDYFVEINASTPNNSVFLSLLLTTLDSLFNNIVALLSTKDHKSSVQIRKQVTTDLSRLSNIAKKSTENRMLSIYLEKGMKHIDTLISDYQSPVDHSEIMYPGPNLLLIEDEPYFIQEIIEALQENLNANVIVTTNAEDATNTLLSDQPIDLVIADLMIPMKDRLSTEPYQGGIDVCLKAKEMRGLAIPIICLTVVNDTKILKELQKIGVNLVINKPALPSEVVDAVHKQLIQQYRIPDPKLISKEVTRRQLELRSTNSEMKVRALWALFQLARYDINVIQGVRDFMDSEKDISIKRIAKNILDQLESQEKVLGEKFVVSQKIDMTKTNRLAEEKMETKFDVFLSHNSIDKKWVNNLKSTLEKHDIRVWFDKDEIRPGDLFAEALEKGLEESTCVAIVISPESVESGWVKEEYYRALSISNSSPRGLRLIPILLRDATLPGFLSSRNWVDFRDETYFADNVKRLVWGINGKKPDVV